MLHDALTQWMEIAPCRVVNRPGPMTSNLSKPYQLQLIRRAGFLVPPTLVTNVPADVEEFRRRHGRLVFKSISSIRSIVQELTPEHRADLGRIRHLPTQFQAFIPGDNVRVHVIGRELFATVVRTEAVDYRYAERDGLEVEMEPHVLPEPVAEACVSLTAALGLAFCGIDLKRTPQREYYCFEANSSPAYSYYEQFTGQPMARALVDYLCGAA